MLLIGAELITRLLSAVLLVRSAMAVQCYACQHLPCSELTCEGSWCMKAVLYDKVRGQTKVIADCVPEDLSDHVKKEECEMTRNDDLGLSGTRCFCRTKLCNGAIRYSTTASIVGLAHLLTSFHANFVNVSVSLAWNIFLFPLLWRFLYL